MTDNPPPVREEAVNLRETRKWVLRPRSNGEYWEIVTQDDLSGPRKFQVAAFSRKADGQFVMSLAEDHALLAALRTEMAEVKAERDRLRAVLGTIIAHPEKDRYWDYQIYKLRISEMTLNEARSALRASEGSG